MCYLWNGKPVEISMNLPPEKWWQLWIPKRIAIRIQFLGKDGTPKGMTGQDLYLLLAAPHLLAVLKDVEKHLSKHAPHEDTIRNAVVGAIAQTEFRERSNRVKR